MTTKTAIENEPKGQNSSSLRFIGPFVTVRLLDRSDRRRVHKTPEDWNKKPQ